MVSETGWTEEFLSNCKILIVSLISPPRERELRPSDDTFIHVARILVQTVPIGTMVSMGYAPCHNWALSLTD